MAKRFQSPDFALRELHLRDNEYNNNTMIAFTSALVNNETLDSLSLGGYEDDDEEEEALITERGWESVSNLLCNKTSILETYRSNHTLHDLGYYFEGDKGDDLVPYLELNENKDKEEVARQKILQTHFSGSRDDDTSKMQEFLDMELEMIPTAISWIGRPVPLCWSGRSVSGLSAMFNLMRRLPDLFDSSPQEKQTGTKRKSKADTSKGSR